MSVLRLVGSHTVTLHLHFATTHTHTHIISTNRPASQVVPAAVISDSVINCAEHPNTDSQHSWMCGVQVGFSYPLTLTHVPSIHSSSQTYSMCYLLLLFILVVCFYSGLGYILGSTAKEAAGDWHWSLRVRAACSSSNSLVVHTLLYVQGDRAGQNSNVIKQTQQQTTVMCRTKIRKT